MDATSPGGGAPAAKPPASARLWVWLSLLAAILAGGLLRAAPLLDNRFHPDEALYGSFYRLIQSARDPMLARVLVDKPPLPFYLGALSMWLLGPTEFAARLPTYYASLVSVALLFALGRRLYGSGPAVLAAWLLALSPFAILFSITLFIDPLLTALVLWALWAGADGRVRALAVALALALSAKQTALLFVPLALALALTRLPAGTDLRQAMKRLARLAWPAALGLALATLAVFAWDAARQPVIGFWEQGYSDNVPGRLVRAGEVLPRAAAWVNLLHYGTGSSLLNILFLCGLAALLASGMRRPNRAALADVILLGYVSIYMAAYWLLAFNVWDRYLLPLMPLLALLLARVLCLCANWAAGVLARSSVSPRTGRRAIYYVLVGLTVLALSLPPALTAARSAYPIGGDHGAYDGIDDAARFIRTLPEGSVLYDHWLSWQWNYYLFNGPVYVAWFPNPAALAEDLAAFGAASPRYLVVPSWEADDELRDAAAQAGYAFEALHTATRRDGTPSFVVYQLQRAP